MFKDLKEHYQGRIKAEKAYNELSEKIKSVLYDPEKDSILYEIFKKSIEEHNNKKHN
jgi:hypothetical protein